MTDATSCNRAIRHRDGTTTTCALKEGHKARCYDSATIEIRRQSKRDARAAGGQERERNAARTAYHEDLDKFRAKQRSYKASWREAWYAYLREYKLERGCQNCGYKGHHAALEFDHIDRSAKSGNVSALAAHLSPKLASNWEIVKTEIAKCQVLCSNCHHIKTFEEQENRPLSCTTAI